MAFTGGGGLRMLLWGSISISMSSIYNILAIGNNKAETVLTSSGCLCVRGRKNDPSVCHHHPQSSVCVCVWGGGVVTDLGVSLMSR